MSKCTRCDSELVKREFITVTERLEDWYEVEYFICQNQSCPNYGNLTLASKE